MGKVIIMLGAAGSGKSTWVKNNTTEFTRVHSADSFFLDAAGNYLFDPRKLPSAHQQCLRQFVRRIGYVAMDGDGDLRCVVDNTNTTVAEIAPYAALALAYGHKLELVHINSPIHRCIERGTHDVPPLTVATQHNRLAVTLLNLPPQWPVTTVTVD